MGRFWLRGATIGLATVVRLGHADEASVVAAANAQPPPGAQLSAQPGTFLSADEIEARRITSLAGVALAAPDITLTPALNSSNTPVFYVRGQGLDNPSQITRDGAVGVYQDGFPIARRQALMFDVPELSQVEVLPDPQGAQYGRNTTGGVVNLITRPPSGEFHLTQSADVGDRAMFRVLASGDSPLWHGLSATATVLASSIDGYVKNPLPGSHDYGEERQRGGRLRVRWDALAHLRVDYFIEKSAVDSTPAYDTNPYLNGQEIFSFFFPYEANPAGPTRTTYRPVDLALSTSSHLAQGLTLAWEPSPALHVKSLTGYRLLDAHARQDYAEFLGLANSTDDGYHTHELFQEVELGGELLDHQISWLAQGTYFKEGGWHNRSFDLIAQQRLIDALVFAGTGSESAALQLRWQPAWLGRRLELTAAARYSKDVKDGERFESDTEGVFVENGAADGTVNHTSYRRVTPSATLSFRWMKGLSTYAKVATGYRSGGALESAPVGQFSSNTFRPESLLTYEVGVNGAFWGDRLRADLAAFSSRYRDVQYAIPLDAFDDQVYSLQQATVRGADFSVQGSPLQDLALGARLAFLHWKVDTADVLPGTPLDPANGAGSPYSIGDNVSGLFALPYMPKYNFTVSSDYRFLRLYRRVFSAHLDYVYRGQFYSDFAAGRDVPGRWFDLTPSVGQLNARFDLLQETELHHHVRLSIWGRNVLNRKYYQIAGGYGSGISQFQTPAGGAASPVGWVARAGAWAEPATYGVSFSYQY